MCQSYDVFDVLDRPTSLYRNAAQCVRGEIEVVNRADNSTEDLLADLTSIIYSFCTRLYGQRQAKRKTEKIVQELEAKDATG
ncbi:MAG: hypothetical protein NVS4B9_21390 [Ktedonobacteraceae bacterium]